MADYSIEVCDFSHSLLNYLPARMSKWTYAPSGKYAIRPEHWSSAKPRTYFEMVNFDEESLITLPSNKKLDTGPLVAYWLSDSEIVYMHYSVMKQKGSQVLCKLQNENNKWKWSFMTIREFKFDNPIKCFVEISQCPLKLNGKEYMVVTLKGLVGQCESEIKLIPKDPRSSDESIDFRMEFMETLEFFKQNVDDFRTDFDPKPLVFGSSIMFPMVCKNQEMRFLSVNLTNWNFENKIVSNKYMEENASIFELNPPDRSSVQFTFWQDEERVIVIWHPIGVYTKFFVGVVDLLKRARLVFRVDSAHGWANISIHPSGILLTDDYMRQETEESTSFSKTKCVALPKNEVARLSELSLEAALLSDIKRTDVLIPKFIREKRDKISFARNNQERKWFRRIYPNYENSVFWRFSRLFS